MSANTRNAYEIVWDSSALQVTCAGRTITVSLKAYDTAIREAQQADFTLLAVHQEWMLTEVTVWVMLLSITALPVGDWMKTCLFTAMYTIAIPQGMV